MAHAKETSIEMTTMMRRFTIICLSAALFAVGLLTIVDRYERPLRGMSYGVDRPCPQLDGSQCRTEL
jgi:hypothetical protein